MDRLRRLLFILPRLVALLATSFLLIATSNTREIEYCSGGGCGGSGSSPTGSCTHASQSITFHVTGACGPEVDIVVSSAANECLITVQGAGAADLPSAGRFQTGGTMLSLSDDAWTLSGFLPEDALPDGGVPQPIPPDAGPFTVVRDAGSKDLGGFSATPSAGGAPGSHATPTLRTCTAWPGDSRSMTLECSGGGVASCQATLKQL